MEYNNWYELYIQLKPVFNVKRRLLNNMNNVKITDEEIWKYLAKNKWCNCIDLSLAEIVNDIITIDVYSINNITGGK